MSVHKSVVFGWIKGSILSILFCTFCLSVNTSLLDLLWWSLQYVYWLLILVQLFATPGILALQAPLSLKFSRQDYQRGLHFLLQGWLGNQTQSPVLQADSSPSEPPGKLHLEYYTNLGGKEITLFQFIEVFSILFLSSWFSIMCICMI